ncbi:aminotransferase class I/II-fold pyridoxal phosphate-dependent enzyme [Alkalibaculum sp. M08DMB]|uniref:Aminotransferase n=2 Tax=Alkalibaculum sporogenes TaxID=2655001 RepID=A0A6A7K9E0_9FIRM|nr:aminotransferase class I/II-fold pyridoxal phosphate-dependent enzyme [Alkalibaculum sporogenes]
MTLAITAKAKELVMQGHDVVGFGAGEPDFDTPIPIKKAAIEAIEAGYTKYTPATGVLELRELIATKLKKDNNLDYTADQIIVNSGAKHSLSTAFQTILNSGEEVIMASPYWVSYPEIIKIAGGVPVIIQTKESNNFKITAKELEATITDKTKALLLNSPSNPIGAVYSREELESIAEVAVNHNIYVISDEIYERLVYDGNQHISIAEISPEIKHLTILINGMSKDYAMTGWRLGYTAGNSEVIKAMGNIQGHAVSHPSSITQYAGIGALNCNEEVFLEMHKEYDQRRKYMVERLDGMKSLSYIYPQGAFYVFINISKLLNKTYNGKIIRTSLELADALLEDSKVALVPGIAFGIDTFVRVSYATTMEEIKKGLDRIEKFIELGV